MHAIENTSEWFAKFPQYNVQTRVNKNTDCDKSTILHNLREQIRGMPNLQGIIIHYNGHGTWKREPHRKVDAGWWACAKDEYIKIEELLSNISDALKAEGA